MSVLAIEHRHRKTTRWQVAAWCLLPLLLTACDKLPEITRHDVSKHTPEATAPAETANATPAASPAATPTNQVTIHYHRQDENYDGLGLWTWDPAQKRTPAQNELAPVGRDDYGPVFQLDRTDYGGADRIGLLPRFNHNWDRKDGTDKFWTTALGNEVWLVGGRNTVLARRPDFSPHVEAAFVDGPTTVAVNLSKAAPSSAHVSIIDPQNVGHPVETSESSVGRGESADFFTLKAALTEPLDLTKGRYRVQVEGFGPAVPLVPRGVLDDRDLFFDADARLGATYTSQGTTFRIFAPTASSVKVVVYTEATGDEGATSYELTPLRKGVWEATVNGDLRGKFYAYSLAGPGLDPAHEVLDPYATNAVASSTRGRITEITAAPRTGPKVQSPTDMVIYEMHVRDFTVDPNSGVQRRGLYLGFTEGGTRLADDPAVSTALDHLSELGVTHVELLPVEDYENDEAHPQFNWGYITSAFFSPEGAYATNPNDDSRVREFKALVEALHARGIGVIMDVVYNHTAGECSLKSVAPGYYYRHLPDGSPANGSGCGNEFRSEAPMARKLIVDSLVSWVKGYGVDGFRFDLMALLDQDTMRQAERELHALNPSIVLFGEPWTGGSSPLRAKSDKGALRQLPVGAFNDDFRNALKGSPDGRDPGFIQNGANRDALKAALLVSPWFAAPGQSINYLTCHDNLVLWDKLKASMPGADDQTLEDTMKLGYLALFTAQGVPFIQGGEEFARTKGGNNNSYDAPDAVNEVDWSLKRKHLGLANYTRAVIALRKAHPVFRLRTREEVAARLKFLPNAAGDKTLMYILDGSGVPGENWRNVCVVLNSDNQAKSVITLPAGQWSIALDGSGRASAATVSDHIEVPRKSGLVLFQR